MWNLMQANCARLRKSWVFWLCAAVLVLLACRSGVKELMLSRDPGSNSAWDRWSAMLFQQVGTTLPVVAAVFSALFLGGEYDGTPIRNKLIQGHGRAAVYFSAWISVSVGTILLFLLHTGIMAGFLHLGFGPFPGDPPVLGDLTAILVMWLAWSALFTAIGMNCTVPAVTVVLCLGVLGLFLVATHHLDPILQRNQEGFRAVLCPFLYNFLPTGQGDQLRDVGRTGEAHLIPYALLFAAIWNGIGALVFCIKDKK